MLSIRINDQALELSDDFSVSLNLKSPVFSSVGDYSFPFRIPSTDRNRSLLGWKNRVSSTSDIYETFPGSLCWNGSVIFSGNRFRPAGDPQHRFFRSPGHQPGALQLQPHLS
jgi:hypothetical protein